MIGIDSQIAIVAAIVGILGSFKQWKKNRRVCKSLKALAFEVPMDVLRSTWKHETNSVDDWPQMPNHWIDLYFSISSFYPDDYLTSANVFRQFFVLLRNLSWHATAVLSGAYESAARELRYILEDMCQALHLDETYPDLSPDEVYEKMREKRPPRGRKLISQLDLPDDIKKDMCEVYDMLNDYVHPSYRQLKENVTDLKVVLFYRHEWFDNIKVLHRKTCDFILFIMLKAFPEAKADFMNKPNIRSEMDNMSFRYTLR